MTWNVAELAVTASWWVFLAYWIIVGRRVNRTAEQEKWSSRLPHMVIMVGAFTILFWKGMPLGILDRRLLPGRPTIWAVGIAIAWLGVALAIWARNHIGQYWSSRVTLKEGHQLIRSGPYAWVRHPIYSGLLLAVMGTAIVMGRWRDVVAVLLVFLAHWFKARKEEALMVRQFGSTYEDYKRETGSLIPRLRSTSG